ncbi:MAG: HAAAP family serine/threonine permease, partial [Corynebacterium sp.]|nr:HAAAP family serine/threonine permease [Corynebacterium sp.]
MSHSITRRNKAQHPENQAELPEDLKASKAAPSSKESAPAPGIDTPFDGQKGAPKWNKEDTVWMLSLFGTAIGAGVLFLP